MSMTLVTCLDKYYKYNGGKESSKKELEIDGYKLAVLTNIVASYLLDKTH